mmetsp:Transcript_2210/g.4957  ORF Transcript_2210/g.4957 Transcript_2210/m.4957 type:complete len:523 (-) Transcript_2210:110-1678(-)
MGERRADDIELEALAHVGDAALDSGPEDLRALLLVCLVLGGALLKLLPRLVRLAARRIDVDDVLAWRADGGIEQRGDEEGAEVLRVLQRAAPVLHHQVRRVLDVRQVEALGVDRDEEVHDCPVARQLAELRAPLLDRRRQLGGRAEHFHSVEGGGVGDHRLPRFDLLAILELDADGPPVLDEDLLDVRVHLQLAAKLLEATHKRLRDLFGAANRHAVGRLVLKEAVEDVEDVRGHGALGGEAAEDAHRVDPVAQEGLGDDLVDGLVQRLKDERQVGKDPRPAHHEGSAASGGREEAGVLPQVHQRDRGHRPTQVLQPRPEGLPLLDRKLRVGRVLAERRAEAALRLRVVADREAPVALRRPVAEARVRLHRHLLAENVHHDAQRVVRRLVEPLKDGWADLKGVLAAIVYAREGVGRSTRLDVRLEHEHVVAVLGGHGAAREAAHPRADHDDVVLALLARQPVARARVRRLLVLCLEGHVVRERHHLLPRRRQRLLNILVERGLRLFNLRNHRQLPERMPARR